MIRCVINSELSIYLIRLVIERDHQIMNLKKIKGKTKFEPFRDQIIQKKLNKKEKIESLMPHENKSQSSLDTISIKFTESNLPSATCIKTSQDHISLTYSVSIENISDQKLPFPDLRENDNLSISIESKHGCDQNVRRYKKIVSKEDESEADHHRNVFKKKSILKISNMDFSTLIQLDKNQESPALKKSRKTPVKSNQSGIFGKSKSPKNDSMIQSRIHSKSKEILMKDSGQLSGSNLFMRTTRFYSLKNDKVVEPKNARKVSIRKQVQRKSLHFETDRKHNRLPIIRGTNFHASAPSSMAQRRKILSCQENVQVQDRNMGNLTQKMILGKSYKMSENDQKAKKYLQKIIQNRNSIIHYCENRSNKIAKEFKENMDEFF